MSLPSPLRSAARTIRKRITEFTLPAEARLVRDEGLTYLAPAKLHRLEAALERAQRVPGGFAEFGVALGGSGILIARHAGGRRFDGFDVFDMIPPPTSDKDDRKSKERYAAIRAGQAQGIGGQTYYGYRDNLYQDVCDSFARHGVPVGSNGVSLHKGLFQDTWPRAGVRKLAFAHIDCDWYDPVAYCLEAVAGVLSEGGVILIDDYHDYGGCRVAVDEFLDLHPYFAFEDGPNPILTHRC